MNKRNELWLSFPNDVLSATEEIVIFSPFLTDNRVSKLLPILRSVINSGVKTFVITLPPDEHPRFFNSGSIDVVRRLREEGITVKFRPAMHEKIAIIDKKNKMVW